MFRSVRRGVLFALEVCWLVVVFGMRIHFQMLDYNVGTALRVRFDTCSLVWFFLLSLITEQIANLQPCTKAFFFFFTLKNIVQGI